VRTWTRGVRGCPLARSSRWPGRRVLGGPRVGVPREYLRVPKRNAGLEGVGDRNTWVIAACVSSVRLCAGNVAAGGAGMQGWSHAVARPAFPQAEPRTTSTPPRPRAASTGTQRLAHHPKTPAAARELVGPPAQLTAFSTDLLGRLQGVPSSGVTAHQHRQAHPRKGPQPRNAARQTTSCRADPMTVSGQFSCPPAGSFVAVSGNFSVAADRSGASTGSRDWSGLVPQCGRQQPTRTWLGYVIRPAVLVRWTAGAVPCVV
jgi:hypothetical protein